LRRASAKIKQDDSKINRPTTGRTADCDQGSLLKIFSTPSPFETPPSAAPQGVGYELETPEALMLRSGLEQAALPKSAVADFGLIKRKSGKPDLRA
jgi:hypothetical protein